MFDYPSFIQIFMILSGIVLLIWRFQVLMMFFDGIKNWGKRKEKHKADKLEFSKLPIELDELISNNYSHHSVKIIVIFHLLKVVKAYNGYFIYISITGGSINIINIISEDFDLISVEPKGMIKNNASFHFNIIKVNGDKDLIRFHIVYEDQFTTKYSKRFLLSISTNSLKEINL